MGSWKESMESDRTRQNGSADRAALARWEGEGGRTLDEDRLPANDGRAKDERAPARPGR